MVWYCNCCGKQCNSRFDQYYGQRWRCCSKECHETINLSEIKENISRLSDRAGCSKCQGTGAILPNEDTPAVFIPCGACKD